MTAIAETLNKSPIDSFQTQWDERVTLSKENQARPEYGYGHYYDSNYEKYRAAGQTLIQKVWEKHGELTLGQILVGIQIFNLETQICLLEIGATDDASYLLESLGSFVISDDEQEWRRVNPNRDILMQAESYHKIVIDMLRQKFPNQDLAEFEAKLPPPIRKGYIYWEPTSVMTIALKRGPQEMLSIFEFIPPKELSLSNFDKRLEIERRVRETDCQPVEREFSYWGEVQGVNFRSFCDSMAGIWGVTGFARNEYNGSVTVVLQGYPEILDAYREYFQEESKRRRERQPSETFIGEREINEGGRITGFHSLYAGETVESVLHKKTARQKRGFWKRLFRKG